MHARFTFIVLALASLMLVTAAWACSSSSGGSEPASEWRDFQVVPWLKESHPISRIADMEREGGFAFVFPSYLPQGLDNKISLRAWAQTQGVARIEIKDSEEGLLIYAKDTNCPQIIITEDVRSVAGGTPGPVSTFEPVARNGELDIAGTKVQCETSTAVEDVNPMLECKWMHEDISFDALFAWRVQTPIPGLIDEQMRQEAMKVIESMILAPEHP